MELSRRGFLSGLVAVAGAAVAAPAIVRVESLMVLPQAKLIVPQEVWIEQAPLVYGHGNNLLTIQQITREAIKLWSNSNAFLQSIDVQYDEQFAAENARIGSKLHITVPKDFVLNKETAVDLLKSSAWGHLPT